MSKFRGEIKMQQEKLKNAFIHLMETSTGKYLYDVNRNEIIKIPEDVYEYLEEIINKGQPNVKEETLKCVNELLLNGYLSDYHVQVSEHPLTEIYEYYIKNKMSHITLQVTQQCNLRCEYCIYNGEYVNRAHSNKVMSREIAFKSIDYLIEHSKDAERIAISFYGGEPLLEYELIKKSVEYVEEQVEGRKISYNFTTNGTLLTKEKMDFLVKHNFNILVSLDGPEKIHNKHRVFAYSTKGSFEIIMKNLLWIKNNYPEFYRNNISFNTVLDPINDFKSIDDFFSTHDLLKEQPVSSTVINDVYAKEKLEYSDRFLYENQYAYFLVFLASLGRIKQKNVSKLLHRGYGGIRTIAERIERGKTKSLPYKSHRSGPCAPGVSRLFITVDGEFYPCERVSESTKLAQIGDIYSGLDIVKALKLLNVERETPKHCRNCWCYYYCYTCIASLDDEEGMSVKKMEKICESTKKNIEGSMLDYCVLKELGYDYQLEA